MVLAVLQIIHFGESAIEVQRSTHGGSGPVGPETRYSLQSLSVTWHGSPATGGYLHPKRGRGCLCTGYTLATSPSSQGPNLQSAVLPTSTLALFRSMLWILLTLITRFFHIWGHIHLDQIDPGRYLPPWLLPSNLLCPSRVCAAHRWSLECTLSHLPKTEEPCQSLRAMGEGMAHQTLYLGIITG